MDGSGADLELCSHHRCVSTRSVDCSIGCSTGSVADNEERRRQRAVTGIHQSDRHVTPKVKKASRLFVPYLDRSPAQAQGGAAIFCLSDEQTCAHVISPIRVAMAPDALPGEDCRSLHRDISFARPLVRHAMRPHVVV